MLTRRFSPAAVLALLFGFEARAQSFDCRRAQSPIEMAICDDRKLAALDFKMEHAFRQALKTAGSRRDALLSDQRAWRRDRDADCAKHTNDSQRLAGCISDFYRIRMNELKTVP